MEKTAGRRAVPPRPRNFCTVGFVAGQADLFMVAGKKMRQINGLFLRRTRAATEEQKLFSFEEFTFDKKFVVGRVTLIHGLLGEDDLGIAGERQNARVLAMIGDVDPPNFHIVVGSHRHHRAQDNISILSFELDAVRIEVHFTAVGRRQRGLAA